MRALTCDDVADELGRTTSWLYKNWADLVANGMPAPLHKDGGLAWSAAQFYAWLDSDLPPDLRLATAAIRAAIEAAKSTPRAPTDDAAIERWKERIDNRFAGGQR